MLLDHRGCWKQFSDWVDAIYRSQRMLYDFQNWWSHIPFYGKLIDEDPTFVFNQGPSYLVNALEMYN